MNKIYLHPLFPNLKFVSKNNFPIDYLSAHVILLNENNQIVLVQEKEDNFFNIPGGHYEKEETASKTAKRECLEELGLKLNNLKYLGNLSYNEITIPLFLATDIDFSSIKLGVDIEEKKFYDWTNFIELIRELNPKLAESFLTLKI